MKTLTKRIEITKENKTFLITLRTVFYANVNKPSWGATTYNAVFKNTGNSIGGSAMMKKSQFLAQLNIAINYLY